MFFIKLIKFLLNHKRVILLELLSNTKISHLIYFKKKKLKLVIIFNSNLTKIVSIIKYKIKFISFCITKFLL